MIFSSVSSYGDDEGKLSHNIYNVKIQGSAKARQAGMDEEGGHVPLLSKRLHVPESSVMRGSNLPFAAKGRFDPLM